MHFLRRLFNRSKPVSKKGGMFEYLRKSSILSNSINSQKDELTNINYTFMTENDAEYFIPLNIFLNLVNKKDITLEDITSSCKHISEIKPDNFSIVEAYPVSKDNHIALYIDYNQCSKDTDYKGDKISLVTWRTTR